MRKYLSLLFITIGSFTSFSQQKEFILDTLQNFKNVKFLQTHFKNFDTITYSGNVIFKVLGNRFYQIDRETDNFKSTDLFPITKEEFKKCNTFDTIPKNAKKNPFADDDMIYAGERIYSQELNYTINGKSYSVFKHIDYNCYDPLCGSRHGHVTSITGVTYFSPDFGILFKGENGNVTLEILVSIAGINVPKDLIIEILKEQNIKNEIIHKYKML